MPTTTVDGTEIAYGDHGSGPPLVLIHAFPLSRWMWSPQVEALSGSYRVITPDLRGFGSSPPFGDRQEARMDRLAADVLGVLDSLELETAVVGGLSMGGYVTMSLMAQAPQRLDAVILADTRAGVDTDEVRHRRSAQQVQVAEKGAGSIAGSMVSTLLSPATVQADPGLADRVVEAISSASAAGVIGALEAMKGRADSVDVLARSDVPALVVVGGEDALTPVSEAEAMVGALRQGQLVVIPGAGHLSNLENPEAFNSAVVSFLATLDRP